MRASGLGIGLHPGQLGGAGLEVAIWIHDQGAGQRHRRALDALIAREADVAASQAFLGVCKLFTDFCFAHPNTVVVHRRITQILCFHLPHAPLSVGRLLTNLRSAHPYTVSVVAPSGDVFLTVLASCQRPDSGNCGTTGPAIGVVGWLLPSSGR